MPRQLRELTFTNWSARLGCGCIIQISEHLWDKTEAGQHLQCDAHGGQEVIRLGRIGER